APAAASAHQSSVSYHDVQVGDDGRVAWTVRLSSRDLYEALGLSSDRDATDDEIRAGGDRLEAYLTARLAVTADGRACPLRVGGPPEIQTQTMRFVAVALAADCPLPVSVVGLDDHLFFDIDPRHSALLRVSHAGRVLTEEFSKGFQHFEWRLDLAPPSQLG